MIYKQDLLNACLNETVFVGSDGQMWLVVGRSSKEGQLQHLVLQNRADSRFVDVAWCRKGGTRGLIDIATGEFVKEFIIGDSQVTTRSKLRAIQ